MLRATPRVLFAAFLAGVLAACVGPGVEQSSGAEGLMRVQGGRFVRGGFPQAWSDQGQHPDTGSFPDASDGGDPLAPPPEIDDITSTNNTIRQGQRGKTLGGRASFNAMTVALALEGDVGYWIVPVTATDLENPPDLDFAAAADFAASVPTGPRRLVVAAADANGRYGHARTLDVTVVSPVPDGDLVVSLSWDQDFDLDLLVTLPDGNTLSSRGVRTPLGVPVRSTNGPYVDLDSNANCAIDGVRTENAVFTVATPGDYQVRVRAAASCGVPETGFHVRILRHATTIAELDGAAFASEVDTPGGGLSGIGRPVATFAVGP